MTKVFDVSMLDEIVDYAKSKEAIPIEKGFTGRNNKPVITAKGWKVKIRWKDGSHDWLSLSQVKNSNLVELAEYAVMKGIENEPAFKWWVAHTIKKRAKNHSQI